ncbi:ABC transporter permease [Alicyclobacillus acidocaldarius]|uniref:Autoinducer 2 import system permease protein LsrC n=1 Tax=Alicyclobacillus acidocaldarius subsp. acidocaldarius (strain ATCC 27009 / DSM 446 / BCRC 14685 / JCM 5260 / KCTC 1825 / NBRC 15652 / NCIMB 11725 / NRRL B-14509 / 104-IA) TaxID=521098 RepID=C8WTL2_ALIAD|nr:ABC transporter permease [Alicyclobacillus acidocaldarius]ACV57754.1 inner-membrane translocator [Alicyclobacillus acidocaldarius subsp. acidocaldarius DSM 446]
MSGLLKRREFSLVVFILIFLLVMLFVTPRFLQLGNLINILLNISTVGILAMGQCLVIITKGIDLSVGANMGLVTLVVGTLLLNGVPTWLSIAIGVATGLVCGGLNAVLISLLRLPPIIVTLGTLSLFSGLMYMVTNGQWIQNLPSSFLAIGNSKVVGIPGPVIVLVIVLIVLSVFMEQTVLGRYIYAVGNNPNAARLAGLSTNRTIIVPYVLMGLLAGIAGVLYLSYNGFSTPTTGADLNLESIAAAVIGGTNVFGGRGTALGSVLGAVLLGVITEALVFFHLPAVWNDAVEGLIILIAVIADSGLRRSQRVAG